MAFAQPSRRSTFKGNILIGEISFPVAVQLKQEIYSLPGHLFHEDCDTRIAQERYCPDHPDEEYIQYYSGIQISESEIIKIDRETKNKLFGRDQSYIKVASTHKLTILPGLINKEQIVVHRTFELIPQRMPNQGFDPKTNLFIKTFLKKLAAKKKFALLEIPFDGILRNAILMPNGVIYSLLYEEEIRQAVNLMLPEIPVNKDIDKLFAKVIDQLDGDFPQHLSCAEMIKRIDAFLISHAPQRARTAAAGVVVTLDDLFPGSQKKLPEGVA